MTCFQRIKDYFKRIESLGVSTLGWKYDNEGNIIKPKHKRTRKEIEEAIKKRKK